MKRWSVSFDLNRIKQSKWLKRPMIYWIGGGAFALIAITELLFGFGLPAQTMPWEAYTVSSAQPISGNESQGTVEALERAVLYAKVNGTAASVLKQPGDIVRSGELLMTISNPDATRILQENEQALSMAQEAMRPALISAKPEVISSPVSGRVTKLSAEPGDVMDDGAYAVIAQDGTLRLVSAVATQQVSTGQTVTVESGTIKAKGVVSEMDDDRVVIQVSDENLISGNAARAMDSTGNIVAEGTLAADKPVVIFGVSGVIKSVQVAQGVWVAQGDPVFTLEGPVSLTGYDAQAKTIEDLIIKRNESQDAVDALSIYAPGDGLLSAFAVKPGDTIQLGQALGTLTDPDHRAVAIPIDERIAAAIEPGQVIALTIDGVPEPVNGTIESVQTRQSVDGASYFARLVIPYTEDIHIGASATAKADELPVAAVVTIPTEAILWQDGSSYILRQPETNELPFSVRRLRGPLGKFFQPDAAKLLTSLGDTIKVPVSVVPQGDGSYDVTGGISAGAVIIRDVRVME